MSTRKGQTSQKQVPRILDRAFVFDEGCIVRIKSDSRGDECIIVRSKLDQVISVDIGGMLEKEPVLFIHYQGGATSSVSFESRTCIQNAYIQLIKLLSK